MQNPKFELSEKTWFFDRLKATSALDDVESRRFDELSAALKTHVRRALGGRIQYIAYGGAAMPPRIMRFFELIAIPLIGSYGSTECGGVTLCGIGENRPGNLGRPFANVRIRIAEDGEILVHGPTVSPGYFKNPEATREAFDEAGWYYTGDLGAIDADGSLRVTGRKKDVFNCSDGSNIYPGFIELQLENEPFVSQAILLGDRVAVMSSRPGRIKEIIDMPFGRPREVEAVRADPRFAELRSHIWRQLHTVRPQRAGAASEAARS